jgi:hypothetical protein
MSNYTYKCNYIYVCNLTKKIYVYSTLVDLQAAYRCVITYVYAILICFTIFSFFCLYKKT